MFLKNLARLRRKPKARVSVADEESFYERLAEALEAAVRNGDIPDSARNAVLRLARRL